MAARLLSSSSLKMRIAVTYAGRGRPCLPARSHCSYLQQCGLCAVSKQCARHCLPALAPLAWARLAHPFLLPHPNVSPHLTRHSSRLNLALPIACQEVCQDVCQEVARGGKWRGKWRAMWRAMWQSNRDLSPQAVARTHVVAKAEHGHEVRECSPAHPFRWPLAWRGAARTRSRGSSARPGSVDRGQGHVAGGKGGTGGHAQR